MIHAHDASVGMDGERQFIASLPGVERVLQRSLRMRSLVRGTWGRGILLRGIIESADLEVEHALWRDPVESAHAALREAVRRPPRDPTQVNVGALWLAALEIQRWVKDPCLRDHAMSFAEHLAGPSVLRYRGAISHLIWPRSVWVDTPFMVSPLLARGGRRDLEREAVRQVAAHVELLGGRSGLLKHMLWPGMSWLEDGALWARGNGWALASMVEVIEALGMECGLVEMAVGLARAMVEHQDRGGLWHVVVDDPFTPLESSAAALVARSVLCMERMGIVGGEVAEAGRRAARAVMGCVRRDGSVARSQPPTVWAAMSPPGGTWPWTQGLVLMMAAEARRSGVW